MIAAAQSPTKPEILHITLLGEFRLMWRGTAAARACLETAVARAQVDHIF